MVIFPNAKINIGLNIIDKRSDGYHNIESIFYPVKYCDALDIVENKNAKKDITYSNSGLVIDCKEEDNLCIKAYKLLKSDFNIPPIKLHLHKVIPFGAGLGGGSSDATNTLVILNNIFNLNLTEEQLLNYSLKIGSDCPFFVNNKPMFVEGRGDILSSIELDLSDYKLVLLNPGVHISTKEAYSNVLLRNPKESIKDIIKYPIIEWKSKLKNDFEGAFLWKYPLMNKLKEDLYSAGALYVSMTGSGSVIYGILPKNNKIQLDSIKKYLLWQSI